LESLSVWQSGAVGASDVSPDANGSTRFNPARLEVSMNCYLLFSLLSGLRNPRGNKNICSTAAGFLLVLALLTPLIGEAQPVTTGAKPENPGKKAPPSEINYAVIEVFPLGDRYIGSFNRSRELALVGDFDGFFVDKKRRVTDFECVVFSDGATQHFTTPLGINNHGDIVGFCHDDVGEMETGFLRSKSGTLFQFTAPGSKSTVAWDVNDFGQIVGQSSGAFGAFSFIRSSDGQYQHISPPRIEAVVKAVAINNSLKVVGHHSDINGQHAFFWDNGQFTELRVPGASGNSDVRQLNNNDQALMFATVDGVGSYYLYDGGNYLRINNPEGYTWQTVNALNDNGELTGFAFDDQNNFFDIIAKPTKN
jgi:probable HAF family extracellular repeat protein